MSNKQTFSQHILAQNYLSQQIGLEFDNSFQNDTLFIELTKPYLTYSSNVSINLL